MKYDLKPYKVIIKVKVEKFISKLDKNLQVRSVKEIEKLALNPVPRNKNHILATKGNAFLCEFGVDKIRFYYEVKHGIIYVEDVKYLELVEVLEESSNHKSGNSKNYPNQQKFIEKLSKWFFSKFKR
ncbi:MAG: hypothetical protein KC589_05760 [Nanoarchaeota archaeon]|nr:hypothetical protein [Nanoarchaeota archaeon]